MWKSPNDRELKLSAIIEELQPDIKPEKAQERLLP